MGKDVSVEWNVNLLSVVWRCFSYFLYIVHVWQDSHAGVCVLDRDGRMCTDCMVTGWRYCGWWFDQKGVLTVSEFDGFGGREVCFVDMGPCLF